MFSVVIPCAGSGKRANLGYNKMLYDLGGELVINRTVNVFIKNPLFQQIIVLANAEDFDFIRELFSGQPVEVLLGGAERMDSVAIGVKAATSDFVFVHDGARMFIDDNLINRLVDALTSEADGYALATKLSNTVLKVDGVKIVGVLERDQLFAMQTPQVVRRQQYLNCYASAVTTGKLFTDEMSILTEYGYDCNIVLSEEYNQKLTNPEDFKGDLWMKD